MCLLFTCYDTWKLVLETEIQSNYLYSCFRSKEFHSRWEHVLHEINSSGTYELSNEELKFGVQTAWRNASRCSARIQWKNLVSHIFPKAQMASNKNVHNFWHRFLALYFMPLSLVRSLFCSKCLPQKPHSCWWKFFSSNQEFLLKCFLIFRAKWIPPC